MRQFFALITRNVISFFGAAVTTASAMLILSLFGIQLLGYRGGPYLGIVTFVLLPSLFVIGLLFIPAGMLIARRRAREAAARGEPERPLPVIDLNRERTRKLILVFFALTTVNIVILALATYKGVEVMDSTEFCGSACHTVMAPEATAHRASPHAHVRCVACHIGPGAESFVKAKLSGTWQLVAVAFDLYPRPIPAPVHGMRSARETCEQCHSPRKFVGDRLRVVSRYAEDEANTERKTVLMLRVGGLQGRKSRGIHWHVDPSIRIRYRSDPERETIREVELTREDGAVDLYRSEPGGGDDPGAGGAERDASIAGSSAGEVGVQATAAGREWRTMDCVDCHNRQGHAYRMPRDEIDAAMEQGRIARSLPFIRREGLKALQTPYSSHEEARQGIGRTIRAFYETGFPQVASSEKDRVEEAIRALGEIYCANVFPWMKVTWGTYPDHIGHETSTGCWRCHDEMHKTASGKTISQDCAICHALVANEEEKPAVLEDLNP